MLAVHRVRTSQPFIEEFVEEGYRGTMRSISSPPTKSDIESITFLTSGTQVDQYGLQQFETATIRNVFFYEGAAHVGWSLDVHRWCPAERLYARRGGVLLVPDPIAGLRAVSLEDGRTLWWENCASTLAVPPRLLDDGLVRCGLNDGGVIDIDLAGLRTVARFAAVSRPGALRAGRSLEQTDVSKQASVWLDDVEFTLRGGRLHGRGKLADPVAGYDVAPPIFLDGNSVVAWMIGRGSDVAIGFFDGKTLTLEDRVEVTGVDDGACLGAHVIDSFLCARVAASDVATLLIDLRTRTLAAVLHHHESNRSGVLSSSGAALFRGAV